MTRRRRLKKCLGSSLHIVTLLAFILHNCNGFSFFHRKPKRSDSTRRMMRPTTPSENDWDANDLPAAQEERNGSRKRRRCVDFPSFAYDTQKLGTYSRRPEYRGPTSDTSSKRRAKSVSVPRAEVKDRLSFVDRLILRTSLKGSSAAVTAASAQRTRLLNERAYARSEPFAAENMTVPPNLSDLSPPANQNIDGFWITFPARILSFGLSYLSFPFIIRTMNGFIGLSENQDLELGRFAPGISILYGTFISLTLSILYNRQRTIQDNVAVECSLLTVVTRNLLSLFRHDKENAIEAGQCAADQIRTLVRSSRGTELMLLMYSDPYARMQELLDFHEDALYQKDDNSAARTAGLIAFCRDTVKDLSRYRAYRLSDEALALPPTHFFILNVLTILILLSYVLSILPSVDPVTGNPSNESSLLFGALSATYILFYNFAQDLNSPFRGVYQVRRSCAASHLLEAKWLIANHPLLRGEVDFEDVPEEDNCVLIRSPGLGDLWFERDDIYKDGDTFVEK